jgi:S-DNA-T family DNA segregation ATPase FtsK/SpoIIIE
VARIGTAIDAAPAAALRRPDVDPARWSMVEYAGHVRDVLLHVRDRLVIGLVEDNPDFKPLYRDQRVDFGLYRGDDAEIVMGELLMAAPLFSRTFARIDAAGLARPIQYAYPAPATRSILWMGQQVVHEVEHHAGDVEATAAML